MEEPDKVKQAENSILQKLKAWGGKLIVFNSDQESPFPPTLLATFIFPQHARPFRLVPMLFPPVLLFTSWVNLQGFAKDAAGASAAWSALYIVLASRRKHAVKEWFSIRGGLRGATMGVAGVNLAGGAIAYAFGKREQVE